MSGTATMSTPKKEGPPKDPPAKRPSPTARGFRSSRLILSKAHERILEKEAEFFGVRRSQLLENILRNRSGAGGFLRREGAPTYDFKESDLTEGADPWLWYFTEETGAHLRKEMLRLGVRDIASWVTWALNDWVGKPEGFVKGKDGKYR